jgi:hypothetical protein
MLRAVRGVLLLATVASGLVVAAGAPAANQPCAIATRGDSPIVQACADGGVTMAKRTMRDLMKRAKTNGLKYECDDCHRNDTNFELTPQARDNFRRLLSAAGAGR